MRLEGGDLGDLPVPHAKNVNALGAEDRGARAAYVRRDRGHPVGHRGQVLPFPEVRGRRRVEALPRDRLLIGLPGREERVGERLQPLEEVRGRPAAVVHARHRRVSARAALEAAQEVRAGAGRDLVQPGAQAGLVTELVAAAPGVQQRLLHRIVTLGG